MYCSSDMMTDEDKEATIKNGRGLLSDGPSWARARREVCNGENRGLGAPKAWEGTQSQGGPMRTKRGFVFLAGQLKDLSLYLPAEHG